ncbi:MAG: phosphoribosylaminoimidazolesuccinocarboxamide synthase [Peptostreptococcaceae bacterium]
MLYEGKAKQIFATENENEYRVYYKDDATAFNGEKKGTISSKGILNNKISTVMFEMLEKNGVETHYIECLSDREMLVKKVDIVLVEVIIRNITAGSFCKRLGVEEGLILDEPIFELCYKNDDFGDPLINEDHVVALKLATREELKTIKEQTLKINDLMKKFFIDMNLKLVDFKLEFGRDVNGNVILADEISPDTCRLWDKETNEKLDKDRFRRDLGDLVKGYEEVLSRIGG